MSIKKAVFLIALLFSAVAAFGQDYTFQGLPWGSTKEQVIAKLGEPNNSSVHDSSWFTNIKLVYLVTLNGYNTRLDVLFHNSKLSGAYYTINQNPFRNYNEAQLKAAFLMLFHQITEKYGAFHEVFTNPTDVNNQYWVWNFNNFHICISSINSLNTFSISYCSDIAWEKTEEDMTRTMTRLPNSSL